MRRIGPDVGNGSRRLRLWTIGLAALGLICVGGAAALAFEPTVPAATGFVSDYAGVIDAGTKRELEALTAELQAKTGAEIAVVTVRTTAPLSAFDYAMKIAEAWKPGAADRDNGVVFLVAVDDRELFVLTGYGVEGALPDGRVGAIRDGVVVPAFRRGDYSGGIRAGTWALAREIAADAGVELSGQGPPAAAPPPSPVLPAAIMLAMLLGLVVLAVRHPELVALMLANGRRRRHGGFGGGFGGGLGGGRLGGGGFGGFGGGGFGGGGAGGRW